MRGIKVNEVNVRLGEENIVLTPNLRRKKLERGLTKFSPSLQC